MSIVSIHFEKNKECYIITVEINCAVIKLIYCWRGFLWKQILKLIVHLK